MLWNRLLPAYNLFGLFIVSFDAQKFVLVIIELANAFLYDLCFLIFSSRRSSLTEASNITLPGARTSGLLFTFTS